jgi:hypothetical protein
MRSSKGTSVSILASAGFARSTGGGSGAGLQKLPHAGCESAGSCRGHAVATSGHKSAVAAVITCWRRNAGKGRAAGGGGVSPIATEAEFISRVIGVLCCRRCCLLALLGISGSACELLLLLLLRNVERTAEAAGSLSGSPVVAGSPVATETAGSI